MIFNFQSAIITWFFSFLNYILICPTPVFSDSALALIHSETKGIPRLINTICTHTLYEAGRNGSEVVEDAQIGRILADAERQRGCAI